jgi:hypothetical protein
MERVVFATRSASIPNQLYIFTPKNGKSYLAGYQSINKINKSGEKYDIAP